MKILNLEQGSPEWLEARSLCFCASDAPVIMGASKYKGRTKLLDEMAGAPKEKVSGFTQGLFNKGHATEEQARVNMELDMMADIPAVVGTVKIDGIERELLASLDGYRADPIFVWEHKLWNETLARNVEAGTLEPHYYWQMEHQCIVTGADKVTFTCSDGTYENRVSYTYESDPVRRDELIAGWKQFEHDLKNHEVAAVAEKVEVEPIKLPEVSCMVNGTDIITNLDVVIASAKKMAKIEMDKKLETDYDFAEKEALNKAVVKARKSLKDRVEEVKNGFTSFAEFSEAAAELDGVLQKLQSHGEKAVKTEKERLKREIAEEAQSDLVDFANGLDELLKPISISDIMSIRIDAMDAMKGRRNLQSMQEAVSDAVAAMKTALRSKTEQLVANIDYFNAQPQSTKLLMSDLAAQVSLDHEAFKAVLAARVKDAEDAKEATVAETFTSEPVKVPEYVERIVPDNVISPELEEKLDAWAKDYKVTKKALAALKELLA